MQRAATGVAPSAGLRPIEAVPALRDWRDGLPMLSGALAMLRDLRLEDAPALLTMLSGDEASRFMTPPPATRSGFERFIGWTGRQRRNGVHACFAIVPHGLRTAAGVVQVRSLEPGFARAEWGFAIGAPYWGTGIFDDAAALALDFAFDIIGIHRLEARAAAENGRGNGALRKLGAVQEGRLRQSLRRDDRYHDQMLWSILAEDWRQHRLTRRPRTSVPSCTFPSSTSIFRPS